MDRVPLSWAWDAVKLTSSLVPQPQDISATGGVDLGDDPGKDPRFRKLVEAVLLSRRILLSYNITLLGILGVFTIWHWSEKVLSAKKRKERAQNASEVPKIAEEAMDEAWSSSSSTIEGTSTPPDLAKKVVVGDETSPLLPSRARPQRKTPGLWRPFYIFKSWMQYQPRSIPIINKALPPNQVSLLVLAFLALNIFYNLYLIPFSLPYLFVFADRCGLIFSANLPLLYLLAAKSQPIKFLTGYSYECLNIFHRRVGELLCIEALLHFLGMMFVWYGMLRHLGFTLAHFLLNRLAGLGLGTFIAYQLLYFTSLRSFRQQCYEIFLASHIFLQAAGLALLFFHYHTSQPYVAISLAIFLTDRLVFRLWLKSSSHPATLTVLEDDETVLLSSNWDISKHRSTFLPKSMTHGWKPNDHIFLTIPQLSTKHTLQSHPFTIFSAAPIEHLVNEPDQQSGHAWFSLLIRAQYDSGFTRILLDYARMHRSTRIRLDGPYGSSNALDILSSSETSIVVAGGSGIAVAYPLLWALLHPTSSTSSDIEVGTSPSLAKRNNVKLLWIIHSASHRTWLPEDKLKELQTWGLEFLITPPTGEIGRPDVNSILNQWVSVQGTGVVVSGPDGLVRDVRNICAAMVRRGEDVKMQVEKFGW